MKHLHHCCGSRHRFACCPSYHPIGPRRVTQRRDRQWQEHRLGPGCRRPIPTAPRCRKRGFPTVKRALVVVAVLAMFASVAIAQDARVRADRLESDFANGVQPNRAYPAQSRIIWRTPEITPRPWEEQRMYDRSSQSHWMFPSTEAGD